MGKFIVTITPPTPNGDLHLGHLAGPFLSADVCYRSLSQAGHDAVLLSYSDDYQSYVLRKAKEQGSTSAAVAQRYRQRIANSLRAVDIVPDHFMFGFESMAFVNEINRYFAILKKAGYLVKERREIPYCDRCAVYGYEAFGRAHCNYCGAESDASQCEACGQPPQIELMGSFSCTLCGGKMTSRQESLYSFDIARLYPDLASRLQGRNHRDGLVQFLDKVLSRNEERWIVTRPGEPGVPVADEDPQQIHTWFSGIAGYKAALEELEEIRKRPGLAAEFWDDPDCTLVHFLGIDCSYSHVVVYPSLLLLERSSPGRWFFWTNKFLSLEGKGFSSSRNHAVWLSDVVVEHPVDAIRFYMALLAPEEQECNFVRSEMQGWIKEVYEGRLSKAVESGNGGEALDSVGRDVIREGFRRIEKSRDVGSFSLKTFATELLALSQQIAEFNGGRRNGALWRLYAWLGEPIHPALSKAIYHRQGVSPLDVRKELESVVS